MRSIEAFEWKHIDDAVNAAVTRLVSDTQRVLFDIHANERAITHRLALYLETATNIFDGWDIDCEYNRIGDDAITSKRLGLDLARLAHRIGESEKFAVPVEDQEGSLVYPDIIVHRRGDEKSNLLVIEVKTSWSSRSQRHDINKLKAFVGGLFLGASHYRFGQFICFNKDRTHQKQWFDLEGNTIRTRK